MGNDEYELVNAKTMGGLAWIHCKKMGYSCPALFTEIGLQGNSGLHYGANDSCKNYLNWYLQSILSADSCCRCSIFNGPTRC